MSCRYYTIVVVCNSMASHTAASSCPLGRIEVIEATEAIEDNEAIKAIESIGNLGEAFELSIGGRFCRFVWMLCVVC